MTVSFPRTRTVFIENKPVAWGLMVALWVFLLGLVAWDAGCQHGVPLKTPASAPGAYAEVSAATVLVARYCDGAPDGIGTGIAVTNRNVITVGHMIACKKGSTSTAIAFADGKTYKTDITKTLILPNMIGEAADGWVLLTMTNDGAFDEKIPTTTISFPKEGEKICAVHAVPTRGISCGEVSTRYTDRPTFSFTLQVEPGNSGSPIYDSNMKLVGFVLDCRVDDKGKCAYGGDGALSIGAVML